MADTVRWPQALLAALVAWALTVGVNYANDYSDGIRGTDSHDRTGPLRLTASGTAAPAHVKTAACIAFAIAALAGIALSWEHPWLIALGAGCIWAAWNYTGGPQPYGYRGWGEVAVFLCYGLVAVLGTQFTQTGHLTPAGLLAATAMGSFCACVNLANNLRDIPSDTRAGKITLAVKLGAQRTRALWLVLVTLPSIVGAALAPLTLLALPLTAWAAHPIVCGAHGQALVPVLGRTGRAMLVWAAALAIHHHGAATL